MKKIFFHVIEWWLPKNHRQTHKISSYNSSKIFILFCLLSIFLSIGGVGINNFFLDLAGSHLVLCTLIITFFMALFLFKITANIIFSISLILLSTSFVIIYTAHTNGGFASPLLMLIAVIPISISLIFNFKVSIFFSFCTCLLLVSYYAFASRQSHQHSLQQLIAILYLIGLSSFFTIIFKFYINRIMMTLHAQEQKMRDLLRVISHDLANPLTIIDGHTNLTLTSKESLSPKEIKTWNTIQRATISIKDILNNVKKWEAISSGKLTLSTTPVSVVAAFENAIFTFEHQIKEKNINLVFESQESNNLYVLAEPLSFKHQVINNVISNAIKFSNSNSTIYFKVKRLHQWIKISIIDQGIGIPENIRRNIFDPSKQTTRRGTKGEPGTGFGMPIVQTYLNHYGGKIQVSSHIKDQTKRSHGTTFHLFLKPAKQPNQT